MQDSEVESGETCKLVISWDTSPSAVVFRLSILADIYNEQVYFIKCVSWMIENYVVMDIVQCGWGVSR